MNGYEYILAKQIQWAFNHGITLVGSEGQRGRQAYTPALENNLFEPLTPDVRKSFEKGDGSEINGSPGSPAKMQAVHSSSALSVNIFQYWRNKVPAIAAACGFCQKDNEISEKIVFEDKYPIDKNFPIAPNIDVVIHNSASAKVKRFAIECKFTEPYSSQKSLGLKPKYLALEGAWDDIPILHNLSKTLCPNDTMYQHLHAAQLIKHLLGLKNQYGKNGFRLLYLWYDVLGKEGAVHRNEIEDFSDKTQSDAIKFHAMSYQELILKLSKEYRASHKEYIKYISNRYL